MEKLYEEANEIMVLPAMDWQLPRCSGHYVLKNRVPVSCENILEWGRMFESSERIVAQDTVRGCFVSTVFLGLDHNFGLGRPLLFETMIFTPDGDSNYQARCSTWDEAEIEHSIATAYAEIQSRWWKRVWYWLKGVKRKVRNFFWSLRKWRR